MVRDQPEVALWVVGEVIEGAERQAQAVTVRPGLEGDTVGRDLDNRPGPPRHAVRLKAEEGSRRR